MFVSLHQWYLSYVKWEDALPTMSVSSQTALIASHQWLQLHMCCHPTKYHLFQSEHHGLTEHNSSPSGQAWSYACSNMHWRPSHKSRYHDNAIHHPKPVIISSKYQTYIQRPFIRSPNWSRSILHEMNSQHRHRDKLTWAREGSRCHRLNTHLAAPLCHQQCNTSTWHLFTNPFEHKEC